MLFKLQPMTVATSGIGYHLRHILLYAKHKGKEETNKVERKGT